MPVLLLFPGFLVKEVQAQYAETRVYVSMPLWLLILIIVIIIACCCGCFRKTDSSSEQNSVPSQAYRSPTPKTEANKSVTVVVHKPSKDSEVGIFLKTFYTGSNPRLFITGVKKPGLFYGTGLMRGMELESINSVTGQDAKQVMTYLNEIVGSIRIVAKLPSPFKFWVRATKPSKSYPLGFGLARAADNSIVISDLQESSLLKGSAMEEGMVVLGFYDVASIVFSKFEHISLVEAKKLLSDVEGEFGLLLSARKIYTADELPQDSTTPLACLDLTMVEGGASTAGIPMANCEKVHDLEASGETSQNSVTETSASNDSSLHADLAGDETFGKLDEGKSDQSCTEI